MYVSWTIICCLFHLSQSISPFCQLIFVPLVCLSHSAAFGDTGAVFQISRAHQFCCFSFFLSILCGRLSHLPSVFEHTLDICVLYCNRISNIYSWIRDFFNNRWHCTRFGGEFSDFTDIFAGVVQGSVAGIILSHACCSVMPIDCYERTFIR